MNKKLIKSAINIFLLVIFAIGCNQPLNKNNQSSQVIIIYPNENLASIAQKLATNKIISDPKIFLFWAKVLKYDRKIKAGRYRFLTNQRTLKVLKELSRGQESKLLITIPEGYNIKDIAKLLAQQGICAEQSFLNACHDKKLLDSLNINNSTVEGYLYPDTYDFMFGAEPKEIICRMVKRFWQIFTELSINRIENKKYIDSIVTLASIIEKEAKIDSERPIIASVFYNRLKAKMPLQSCATVQYILPHRKENLSIEDTKIDSPYNTYIYLGLPPSPICNPGKASILAAIKPAKTQYRFFAVDENGHHRFSKTFSEHQQFVKAKINNKL